MKKECMSKKMLVSLVVLMLTGLLIAHNNARADLLVLKNGKTVDGKFVDAIDGVIQFQVADSIKKYSTTEIHSIIFIQSATDIIPAPDALSGSGKNNGITQTDKFSIILPVDTELPVRTTEKIDSKHERLLGKTFLFNVDKDVVFENKLVIPKGSKVTCTTETMEKLSKKTGNQAVKLVLTDIVINNEQYNISTGTYQVVDEKPEGFSTTDTQGRNIILSIGEKIEVPENTLIIFKLSKPLKLK
ncbi:MAG: hypothetical protein A2161_05925 [Candidatus Schekmanbacteria bacterium RBG_13_48_7]|uniref:Uncharacterized protein n=1 Tax=Candidatus Schekmanbacteria bacterium RBG_13_48_7 TaxID=1817878 RepID=A0A1F7RSY7_9BACT|nr:MAG: hypothetical protein A2161_05925 [Candidatus Schekmanbacteria bacterium RBG_13_48_7]